MPKILCIISLIASALVLLLFALDLVSGVPFGGTGASGLIGHLGIIGGAAIVGTFSVLTLPECR
ncbi:MAG: hypothetical protein FWG73_09085 [Planctomycetaceae bacterium]|nr:hypothetical protein [Planctomycetaceae bacterium]